MRSPNTHLECSKKCRTDARRAKMRDAERIPRARVRHGLSTLSRAVRCFRRLSGVAWSVRESTFEQIERPAVMNHDAGGLLLHFNDRLLGTKPCHRRRPARVSDRATTQRWSRVPGEYASIIVETRRHEIGRGQTRYERKPHRALSCVKGHRAASWRFSV